ncbi:MAG: hypothetical protein Q8882_08750 [Bacillota bacterium]|nr:hypothetical protein [Bacillota bacterium]
MTINKIIAIVLMVIGAIMCYGASFILEKIKKTPAKENEIVYLKLASFAVVAIAVLVLFLG